MKKNGQYVGVDEKYIPKDEKYVDNDLNSEIKDDLHNMYKGAKGYVSDKDNQKKMKNVGRKGLKVLKGIGIGYIVFLGIIVLIFLIIIGTMISRSSKMDKNSKDFEDLSNNVVNKMEIENFNYEIELYSGTQYGQMVKELLDNIVTKVKKNTEHSISVVYDSKTISKADEITALKKQINTTTEYEVSMDYDSNGFINKVTISNY